MECWGHSRDGHQQRFAADLCVPISDIFQGKKWGKWWPVDARISDKDIFHWFLPVESKRNRQRVPVIHCQHVPLNGGSQGLTSSSSSALSGGRHEQHPLLNGLFKDSLYMQCWYRFRFSMDTDLIWILSMDNTYAIIGPAGTAGCCFQPHFHVLPSGNATLHMKNTSLI